MTTELIKKRLEQIEHPQVDYWEQKIKTGLQRSILAFQVAFGTLSFGSATALIYSVDKNLSLNDVPWGFLIIWIGFFAVFRQTIKYEHWKEDEAILRKRKDIDIDAKDKFNERYIDWLYEKAENLTVDEAQELFKTGMIVFSSVSVESVDRKLSDVIMLMNNLVFHTQKAITPVKQSAFDKIKAKVTPKKYKTETSINQDPLLPSDTVISPPEPYKEPQTEEIQEAFDEKLDNEVD